MNYSRISKTLFTAALAVLGLCAACWAGPPAPPVIASTPRVPVGGAEVTIATSLAIAAYGIWKSRK